MCILSYLPPNTGVDVEGLFNGGVANPHGHGWAIVAGKEIVTGKSLELAEALDEFAVARELFPEGPALFHSRWATHGSVCTDNVHPFLVGRSPLTVVAHNGVLPTSAHPAKGDDRSDTRLFADEILPQRYRRLDRVNVQAALANWCGKFNKLVILTVDPRYRRSAYIINETAGQWDTETGIWHSNGDYLRSDYWDGETDRCIRAVGDEECVLCQARMVGEGGYCEACSGCQDCYEDITDCQCWNCYEAGYQYAVGRSGEAVQSRG